MPILAKKFIFSEKAHFDLGNYVNKKNCCIWGQKTRTHTLKSRRTQNESLFGADFGPVHNLAIFFENKQGEAITVNGDRYRTMWNEFLFTKIEEEDIGNNLFRRRYVPHSRIYTRCFAPCFWAAHYQSQSWCRLELGFSTVGLLFVGCRQRLVLCRQARDNWCLKG